MFRDYLTVLFFSQIILTGILAVNMVLVSLAIGCKHVFKSSVLERWVEHHKKRGLIVCAFLNATAIILIWGLPVDLNPAFPVCILLLVIGQKLFRELLRETMFKRS